MNTFSTFKYVHLAYPLPQVVKRPSPRVRPVPAQVDRRRAPLHGPGQHQDAVDGERGRGRGDDDLRVDGDADAQDKDGESRVEQADVAVRDKEQDIFEVHMIIDNEAALFMQRWLKNIVSKNGHETLLHCLTGIFHLNLPIIL